MKKTELVKAIADKTEFTQASVAEMLNAFTEIVVKSVKKGDPVQLVGFGTFESVKRKARTGVNPATGAKIKIPAAKVPKFKPGKAFKDAVKK